MSFPEHALAACRPRGPSGEEGNDKGKGAAASTDDKEPKKSHSRGRALTGDQGYRAQQRTQAAEVAVASESGDCRLSVVRNQRRFTYRRKGARGRGPQEWAWPFQAELP